ncbi:hypothetical protein NN561_012090 [Cricetulus griseus]
MGKEDSEPNTRGQDMRTPQHCFAPCPCPEVGREPAKLMAHWRIGIGEHHHFPWRPKGTVIYPSEFTMYLVWVGLVAPAGSPCPQVALPTQTNCSVIMVAPVA